MRNWNDRLKKAFDESDYNKTRFAKAVGVSGATVTDWMSGEIKSIKAPNAQRICSVLKIENEWLISGKGPMRANEAGTEFEAAQFGVPLISWVQAGVFCESPDLFQPGDAED